MEFQCHCDNRYRCQSRNLFEKDVATVLVSFARSGNSPESVATVDLAKALVDELYQVTITCAADGKLALQAHGDDRNLLLLQPAASNDAGFAMTSSFTSMMLTALLVFDPNRICCYLLPTDHVVSVFF